MTEERSQWPARWSRLLLIPAIALGALVFLPSSLEREWFSDDHNLAYGVDGGPVPSLGEALRQGGGGELSIHRLLCYPFIGYVGGGLGPLLGGLLQLGLHLLVAWLFGVLLLRLEWPPMSSAFAVALFAVSPWSTQPVVWWSAVCTVVSTVLVVCAAHAYLSWSLGGRKSWRWLTGALLSMQLALTFYELWLVAYPLFAALELYSNRTSRADQKADWRRNTIAALTRASVMLVPSLIYIALFVFAGHGSTHNPSLSLYRAPVVFLSIHLRAYHWLADTPWTLALDKGLHTLTSVPGVLVLIALAGISALILRQKLRANRGTAPATATFPLTEALLLSWGWFLGSRLVFLAQGGVATHTRHNYGAAMAAAMAFVVLHNWASQLARGRVLRRELVSLASVLVLGTLSLTTMGIAQESAENSKAEQETFEAVLPKALSQGEGGAVLVVGTPSPRRTELAYYSEKQGLWLNYRLRKALPGTSAYVVDDVRRDGDSWVFAATGRGDTSAGQITVRLPLGHTEVFRWIDGQLEHDRSHNDE